MDLMGFIVFDVISNIERFSKRKMGPLLSFGLEVYCVFSTVV